MTIPAVNYPEVKLVCGIRARRAGNEDERISVAAFERQTQDDIMFSLGDEMVILSLAEAGALAELLNDLADRIREKVEARP
jgi:hypothetical protein